MLDNIIDKNIIFLQNHGVKMSSKDDRAIYKYGLQILYYYIIDLVVIFSLAYCFGKLYETAVITFIFGLFQVFGGGYHAKTPSRCLFIMIAGATVGNIFIILIADKIMLNIMLMIVFSTIVFMSKPITNKKHPVDKKIRRRSKIIMNIIIILILISVFTLNYFNENIETAIITVALGLYLISMIISKIKLIID
jgi:accessory gene regulator B